MTNRRYLRFFTIWLLFALSCLGGCDAAILNPKGYVGEEIRVLIYLAVGIMLIVVLPVIFMALYFPFKYRASNTKAKYSPNWDFSGKIEAVIWGGPLIIILILGAVTWHYTHKLDPYKPIPSDVSTVKPIRVQVVALNWKWLFIYPDLNIATVNEVAFPKDTPVNFEITSDTAITSFFIPQLGSQIYGMAGMKTQLHLIANEEATFQGTAANYIGYGYSYMQFKAIAYSNQGFDDWVAKVKQAAQPLNEDTYNVLLAARNYSAVEPVTYYSSVDSIKGQSLFDYIIGKYMPMDQQMHHKDGHLSVVGGH